MPVHATPTPAGHAPTRGAAPGHIATASSTTSDHPTRTRRSLPPARFSSAATRPTYNFCTFTPPTLPRLDGQGFSPHTAGLQRPPRPRTRPPPSTSHSYQRKPTRQRRPRLKQFATSRATASTVRSQWFGWPLAPHRAVQQPCAPHSSTGCSSTCATEVDLKQPAEVAQMEITSNCRRNTHPYAGSLYSPPRQSLYRYIASATNAERPSPRRLVAAHLRV